MDQIKQLFSPPVMAALRYVLAALAPLLAVVGIVALSPQQIDKIIAVAQQVGTAVGAIGAFLGIVIPIIMGALGTRSATQTQQIKSVSQIASDPTQAQSAPAQQALVEATSAIAHNNVLAKSDAAKDTLIAATIALDNVQTILTDKETADRQPSESVVAADTVTIHPM